VILGKFGDKGRMREWARRRDTLEERERMK
jgi:hypothetical protein